MTHTRRLRHSTAALAALATLVWTPPASASSGSLIVTDAVGDVTIAGVVPAGTGPVDIERVRAWSARAAQ